MTEPGVTRSRRRNVVLSEEEDEALVRMMKQTGFSRSVLLRLALRQFLREPPPVIASKVALQETAA